MPEPAAERREGSRCERPRKIPRKAEAGPTEWALFSRQRQVIFEPGGGPATPSLAMRSAFHCLVVVATVLACAAAVDVHLITASARSQEVATVLETKLRSRGWFKGNTAVTTAAGETAAVHAIIAGKRSGVDTVILWRPVHTSATEASEANVELAEDAGIAIVFLEAGPAGGTQQIAFQAKASQAQRAFKAQRPSGSKALR